MSTEREQEALAAASIGRRVQVLTYKEHVLAKATEPKFVLMARDPQAPELLEQWAKDRRIYEPDSQKPDVAEAMATAMRSWKKEHPDIGMRGDHHCAFADEREKRIKAQEQVCVSPTTPSGWQLVPIDPTEAMLAAFGACDSIQDMVHACLEYKAMLAAAPRYEGEP